jgi:Leucine-rich repeat (LRR) protein
LRAALPEVKVSFDGAALSKTPRAGAAKPTDSSPKAIATWVRLMGGSADLVNGHLTSINLAATSLSDAQLAFLENLPGLQKLELQVTQVSDLGLNSIQRLTGLRELDLSNTTVSSTGLSKLAALSRLETLKASRDAGRRSRDWPS